MLQNQKDQSLELIRLSTGDHMIAVLFHAFGRSRVVIVCASIHVLNLSTVKDLRGLNFLT